MLMKFSRTWAMPNSDTFSVPPIGEFVQRHIAESKVSVDPFARNKRWATHTNDINPNTEAEYHLDAVAFLDILHSKLFVQCDLMILDPPYSPRQISECYKEIGKSVSMADTQSGNLYRTVRDAADKLVARGGRVISFGWNSVGMGIKRGYQLEEIMLCCHGGAHNDTICISEVKL